MPYHVESFCCISGFSKGLEIHGLVRHQEALAFPNSDSPEHGSYQLAHRIVGHRFQLKPAYPKEMLAPLLFARADVSTP